MAFDSTKKRKLAESNNGGNNNGGGVSLDASSSGLASSCGLTPTERRRMIQPFTKDQLVDILQDAVIRHADVRSSVRLIADTDLTLRKLFVRGLGAETTTQDLVTVFSAYGEVEDAVVVIDKVTGRSKGYGFVVFKHVDGALLALREPSKKIGGRVAVSQLAATGPGGDSTDVWSRKIFVGNVPVDASPEKLLAMFSQFGEIEEGPLGFDKQTGKSRGFALFVYKTAEGAQSALVESVKIFEGRQLFCRLAIDGKRKTEYPGGPDDVSGDGFGMEGQYGFGRFGNLGGHPGGMQGPPQMGHFNSPSMGPPSGFGPGTNHFGGGGGGSGGPFGGYNMGPGFYDGYGNSSGAGAGVGPGYFGGAGAGAADFGVMGAGAGPGGFGPMGAGVGPGGFGGGVGGNPGNFGGGAGGMGGSGPGGAPMYRPPAAGGYPENRPYGMASLGNYPAQMQHHQPTRNTTALRNPPSGFYPQGHPYI